MNGSVKSAPSGPKGLYVRALFDYHADDGTSLSFRNGDIIEVVTRLESGWWDGIVNGVRGWFPSNFCELIPAKDQKSSPADDSHHANSWVSDKLDTDDDLAARGPGSLTIEGTVTDDYKPGTDFWIPQATTDGRLYYYNTMTGDCRAELPMESPVASTETGPRDRNNVKVLDRSRLPIDLMASGSSQDNDDHSTTSVSEGEDESLMHSSRSYTKLRHRTSLSAALSPSASMDSMNGSSPGRRPRGDVLSNGRSSVGKPSSTMASATAFTSTTFHLPTTATLPRSFFDDGATPPLTWSLLVTNMKLAINRYREAIVNNSRSEFVARAEDISDHLRLLLAAGSGTTDNHSGQPSIISTNKALYPHFRDMMSKFSKLVISSHIASSDWPSAESVQKCLQEADGVLHGVFSYVEVARQQRGEEIPRLFPGFVIGSSKGGSWQNNGLGSQDPVAANFLEDDDSANEPTAALDGMLLESLTERRRAMLSCIRELDKSLASPHGIITPHLHEVMGNTMCMAGSRVMDSFKTWIATIESIDLSCLGNTLTMRHFDEYSMAKQSVYDGMSDLVLGCQAVAGPLADEWSQVRGETLQSRLAYVRQCARSLEANSSHILFSLQLLSEEAQAVAAVKQTSQTDDAGNREHQLPRGRPWHGDIQHAERPNPSSASASAATRPPFVAAQSFMEGESPKGNLRKGDYAKVKKIFGEDPSPQTSTQPDDTPEFLRLDYEDDVSWDTKTSPPTVRGGTLLALVEQLTRHDKLDSSFNTTFLLTYRSFTSGRELFELLVKRFGIQPPDGLIQSNYEIWRDRKQKPIRFRVVNILKSWFDSFWTEEFNDESKQLIRDVFDFARDRVKSTDTPGSGPLMSMLTQRLQGKEAGARKMIQTLNQSTPSPILPKNIKKLKFLDIDSTEFARQLTIIESRLYGKIKAAECLNKTWQRKVANSETDAAPNVKALILHSNQLTNWVAEMILGQMDVKKRVVVIKHFVTIADKCRSLNNFSTLTSIISALGTAPIARLKRTWEQVPQRVQAVLETMRGLMASTKNFGEYRESLHAANPPCIPFFGVYLTDLTFIEDGIPSVIKKTNLINFAKRAKTAEVIRDIQQYQNVGYSLQSVPELQDYLLSNMQAAGDVHEMYDKSLQIEPREREDEKIVRYVALRDQLASKSAAPPDG